MFEGKRFYKLNANNSSNSSNESKVSNSSSKGADMLKSENPGWATMRSTSAFRAINFELFVRPVSNLIMFFFITQNIAQFVFKKKIIL